MESTIVKTLPDLSLDPLYVTGLCEAEASFTYGRTPSGIRPRFKIRFHESDKELIFAIHRFFGVGAIYGPTWTFAVTKKAELARIIEHFEANPLKGAKAAGYQIWKRICELTFTGSRANWAEVEELATLLSSMSTKARHPSASGLMHP